MNVVVRTRNLVTERKKDLRRIDSASVVVQINYLVGKTLSPWVQQQKTCPRRSSFPLCNHPRTNDYQQVYAFTQPKGIFSGIQSGASKQDSNSVGIFRLRCEGEECEL